MLINWSHFPPAITLQAFTGLDDVAVCLDILEQKGWDLMVRFQGAVTYIPPVEMIANGVKNFDWHKSSLVAIKPLV